MKVQKTINEQEFEEYKINLIEIKNKYLIESMKIKEKLLADEAKIIKEKLKRHNRLNKIDELNGG